MPACARLPEAFHLALLASLFTLAGCSETAEEDRFAVKQVAVRWASGHLDVNSEQRLALSNEAREALIHGVPLTLSLELRLRSTSSQTRVARKTSRYEIRYMPMSDHYQLSYSDETTAKTFPRLRHVLSELSSLNVSIKTGALPAGEYELLTRLYLDQTRMPPPMRLPVLLSSKWKHDSSWSSWPLEIETGA